MSNPVGRIVEWAWKGAAETKRRAVPVPRPSLQLKQGTFLGPSGRVVRGMGDAEAGKRLDWQHATDAMGAHADVASYQPPARCVQMLRSPQAERHPMLLQTWWVDGDESSCTRMHIRISDGLDGWKGTVSIAELEKLACENKLNSELKLFAALTRESMEEESTAFTLREYGSGRELQWKRKCKLDGMEEFVSGHARLSRDENAYREMCSHTEAVLREQLAGARDVRTFISRTQRELAAAEGLLSAAGERLDQLEPALLRRFVTVLNAEKRRIRDAEATIADATCALDTALEDVSSQGRLSSDDDEEPIPEQRSGGAAGSQERVGHGLAAALSETANGGATSVLWSRSDSRRPHVECGHEPPHREGEMPRHTSVPTADAGAREATLPFGLGPRGHAASCQPPRSNDADRRAQHTAGIAAFSSSHPPPPHHQCRQGDQAGPSGSSAVTACMDLLDM